jgi:nucleotide-binding universal stress UspA family protein
MTGPVLCAVDVSNPHRDDNVLRAAARLAALDAAQLDVITVVPDYGMSVVGSFFDAQHHDKAVEESRQRLHDLVTEVLGKEANESVRHVVVTGNTYDEILRVAEADGAALIVIGAHQPDLRDYLLGPNAARVVRHAKCSVLVVR